MENKLPNIIKMPSCFQRRVTAAIYLPICSDIGMNVTYVYMIQIMYRKKC